MKKFAIITLTLVLTASLFTACRRAPAEDTTGTGNGDTSTSTTAAPTTRPAVTTEPSTQTVPSTEGIIPDTTEGGMIDGNGKIRRPISRRN